VEKVSIAIRTSCAQWFSHPENSVIFAETGITDEEYKQRYEGILVSFFEYFLIGGSTDSEDEALKKIQRDIVPFLNRIHPGYTKTHEFLSAIYLLKRIFLSLLTTEGLEKMEIPELQRVHGHFDSAIEILTALFSKNRINILEGCNQAFDLGTIISITNPKGIIIYANEPFCRLSEYTKDELIGKPHSIVRHPDMPKEVFRELWETISAKKTWFGIMKNKKK
jgi:PAS domain-containing protein